MTLATATHPDGRLLGVEGPTPCEALRPFMGVRFRLPCLDPWLLNQDSRSHTYLQAATEAWAEHPEWMDFLDQDSPAWDIKRAARDLYLDRLLPRVTPATRVLDFGCGIGRMTHPLLDLGCEVHGVDGDLPSLQRCAWHAAGRAGSLDLHWSTHEHLPDAEVDLVLAVEVLCYFEDPAQALAKLVQRLRPGGTLFLSMEARYGWAVAPDAPVTGLADALDSTDLLHIEGDRFVHLYDEQAMRALLEGAGLVIEELLPTHYLADGPFEDLLPSQLTKEVLLEAEQRMRDHPVYAPLNRIWTAIATKP